MLPVINHPLPHLSSSTKISDCGSFMHVAFVGTTLGAKAVLPTFHGCLHVCKLGLKGSVRAWGRRLLQMKRLSRRTLECRVQELMSRAPSTVAGCEQVTWLPLQQMLLLSGMQRRVPPGDLSLLPFQKITSSNQRAL